MTGYLDDIASDLSAIHRVDDPGQMESAAFFMLASRLPAYPGALAAVAARQASGEPQLARARTTPAYERTSPSANNGRTADAAPPATEGSLAALNAQLGAQWFSYRTAKAEPDG